MRRRGVLVPSHQRGLSSTQHRAAQTGPLTLPVLGGAHRQQESEMRQEAGGDEEMAADTAARHRGHHGTNLLA